jgi:hypothetical protein
MSEVLRFPARVRIGRPKPKPPRGEDPSVALVQVEAQIEIGFRMLTEIARAQMSRLALAGHPPEQVREEMRRWLALAIHKADQEACK